MSSIEVATCVVVTRPDGTTKIYDGDTVSPVEELKLLVSAIDRDGEVTISVDRTPTRTVPRSTLRGKDLKEAVRQLVKEFADERKIKVA